MKIQLLLLGVVCLFTAKTIQAQIYDTNGDFVETFAGSGEQGFVNGQGQLTKFYYPTQITSDTASNLYVWDSQNYVIREITPQGNVSTFAGGGTDLEGYGTNVNFSNYGIGSMIIDHSNIIWFVVSYNGPCLLLNIGTNGYVTIQNGGAGLTNLTTASGICFDSANNLYYTGGDIIYRYIPNTGVLQPFAGNGTGGYVDGNGTIFPEFSFGYSPAMTIDEANNIYVWDSGNYRIRRIDQNQNVTTIAGTGPYPENSVDGVGTNASFYSGISSMFSDNSGNVYFACGTCIRRMNAQTNVVTMAGSFRQSGYNNGVGNGALFNNANSACIAGGIIYIADSNNERIRDIAFNPQPQIVSPSNLAINTFPGIQMTGSVGRTYEIQSSPEMTNWTNETTFLLTSSPYLWIDQHPIGGNKFYRAIELP